MCWTLFPPLTQVTQNTNSETISSICHSMWCPGKAGEKNGGWADKLATASRIPVDAYSVLSSLSAILELEGKCRPRTGRPHPLPQYHYTLYVPWLFLFMPAAVALRLYILLQISKILTWWVSGGEGKKTPMEVREGTVLSHVFGYLTRTWALGEHWWKMEPPLAHVDTCLSFQYPEALCEDFQ